MTDEQRTAALARMIQGEAPVKLGIEYGVSAATIKRLAAGEQQTSCASALHSPARPD